MNSEKTNIFQNLIPFLIIGISIALLLGLLFVFAYVLVWGLIIGGVLWLAFAIKRYFFPSETMTIKNEKRGRIIDQENKK